MSGGVIHKRQAGGGNACGRASDTGDASTLYWGGVTCERCLEHMPPDTGGRTSIKRSNRVEGDNFID